MGNTRDERRQHRRWDMACPITLQDAAGQPLLQGRSLNVSNGGLYLTTRDGELPVGSLPERITVLLSVPRSTPNSFMFEEFRGDAAVVRHLPPDGQRGAGVALRFVQPLGLDLDV